MEIYLLPMLNGEGAVMLGQQATVVWSFAASRSDAWMLGWDALAAVGTCAAVLVAMAIWIADKVAVERRRFAAAKLFALILYPEIGFVEMYLMRLSTEIGKEGSDRSSKFNECEKRNPKQVSIFLGEQARVLAFPMLDRSIERLELLPELLSVSVGLMLSDVQHCRKMCEEIGGFRDADNRMESIDLIRVLCVSAIESTVRAKNEWLRFGRPSRSQRRRMRIIGGED